MNSRFCGPLCLVGMMAACVMIETFAVLCRAEESDRFPSIQGSPRNAATPSVPRPEQLPIDLPTVLRLAGSDSLDVKLAGERVSEAKARRLAADMQFLPSVQPAFVNRWHEGLTQAVNGPFLSVGKQSTALGTGVSAEWRIGESYFQSLAARRRVLASETAVRSTAEDAQIRAVNAFFNLVLARADQAIVEDRLKHADETVRMTEELQKGGAGLLSEVKRSQAARAEVKQRLAVAKEKVRVASLNLTDVLHIDPLVSLVPIQEPQELLTLVAPERDITDLAIDAVAYRPELKQSRAYWSALDSERKAALLGPLIPTIRAEAFGGGLGRHPDELHHTADYAVGLQWKIGAGGIGDVSRVRLTESQQRQESIRFQQISDRVVREVVENLAHVESTREQVGLSKEEVAAASETLNLSRERIKNGAGLTLEVISAEDALFAAQSRAAQNVSEFNKAQYGLLRSVGGFRNTDALIGTKGEAGKRAEVKPEETPVSSSAAAEPRSGEDD